MGVPDFSCFSLMVSGFQGPMPVCGKRKCDGDK